MVWVVQAGFARGDSARHVSGRLGVTCWLAHCGSALDQLMGRGHFCIHGDLDGVGFPPAMPHERLELSVSDSKD
jgi:hypothetical protein